MSAKGAPQTATNHHPKTNHDTKKRATILPDSSILTLIYGIKREILS